MNRRAIVVGLVAAAMMLGWQWLTVKYNYGGNWTALFCTGGEIRIPPALAGERIYTFPGSYGYDGQYYHFQAHDPFLKRGMAEFMDSPRLRYRRMLVPAAAWLLALGQDRWVHVTYFFVVLLSAFLGTYWSARLAALNHRPELWGLAFLLVPAAAISMDRMTIDLTLAAFVAGLALATRQGSFWRTIVFLSLAVLTRETGALLAGAYFLFWLAQRRWSRAALSALSILPAAAWYFYVGQRASVQQDLAVSHLRRFLNPLEWFEPLVYELPLPVSVVLCMLDYAVMAGVILAMFLALKPHRDWNRDPLVSAAAAYVLLMAWYFLVFGKGDPFSLPRIVSPLLILVAVRGSWLAVVPLLLVFPRVLAQLAPQAAGLLRGIF